MQDSQDSREIEELLDVPELAKCLRTKPSWVYSRTRETGPNKIPMVRVGKYCRFRIKDVLAWLESRS